MKHCARAPPGHTDATEQQIWARRRGQAANERDGRGQGRPVGQGGGPREVIPRAAVMQDKARAGVKLREDSTSRAPAGSRNATVCTAFLRRVRSTPRASSQSTPPPASELPTAITVHGKNANMLDACTHPFPTLTHGERWPPSIATCHCQLLGGKPQCACPCCFHLPSQQRAR